MVPFFFFSLLIYVGREYLNFGSSSNTKKTQEFWWFIILYCNFIKNILKDSSFWIWYFHSSLVALVIIETKKYIYKIIFFDDTK